MSRENDQPARDRLGDPERDIDRDQHRLVGERIEIGAELGRHAEAFRQEPVHGVADAGGEKQGECDLHLARSDRPDHDRHQQDAAKRY